MLLALKWSDQFKEIRPENRIDKKNRNQDRTKITLEEELDQRYQKIQEMDPKRENDQFQMESILSYG